ncbi:MAG: methyltransferase [Hamadaea sp.]|uniref:methyltransferase n=1 Tax=Hamadaea sp. TaxID=2024425 RepID=UPI0017B0A9C1|nr:methyltransferase [Hamadaea sp.]NUT21758.1 methyltransferase [Hamadaea sp.]
MTQPTQPRRGLRAVADLATPMALRVAATLRLADHVAAGRRTPHEIAAACDAHPGALDRLMRHLVTIGVFTHDGEGAYATTELGEQLRDDHPAGRRKWLDITGAVGRGDLSFADLAYAVRTGRPAYPLRYGASFWDDLAADPALSKSFDELMDHHMDLDNDGIAEAYPWMDLGHVVDVGGGNGKLLSTVLTRHRDLRGTLVDLPGPAEHARKTLHDRGLADRAEVRPGSFFDPLPPGAGGYVLSAILHDWDDDAATAILRRCAEAATSGGADGVVLVIEAVGADGESPDSAMDLRMLTFYGGAERGVTTIGSLAGNAGLVVRRVWPVGRGSFMSIVELGAC